MNEMPFLSTSKIRNTSVLYCLLHIFMSVLHVLLWLVLTTSLAVKTTGSPSTDGDTEAPQVLVHTHTPSRVAIFQLNALSPSRLAEGASDAGTPCQPGTEEVGTPTGRTFLGSI